MLNILIIIILTLLTISNLYYLFYFKRKASQEGKIKEIDNYYKLDAKIELQKYLALGLIAIAAFFGYTEFTYINEDLKNVKNIDSTISRLESDYHILDSNYKDLVKKYDEFDRNFNLKIKKLNIDLDEATKRIPEDKLRILAESLIRSRIEYMANISRVSARGYYKEEIQDEIIKSMESLAIFGFDENEIKQIRNDLEKDIDSLNF